MNAQAEALKKRELVVEGKGLQTGGLLATGRKAGNPFAEEFHHVGETVHLFFAAVSTNSEAG